jgi:hypothetical protein
LNLRGIIRELGIAFCPASLRPDANSPQHARMLHWRSAMRELSAEARLHRYARSLTRRRGAGLHAAVLYGAFAVIAAIVFGTLSVHPF